MYFTTYLQVLTRRIRTPSAALREEIMNLRQLVGLGSLLTCVFLLYFAADRFIVAKAVSPPHASARKIIAVAMHTPYAIATPHQTVWSAVKVSFVPTVSACTNPTCNQTEPKPNLNPNSPGQGSRCPNCVDGPCTYYGCNYTLKKNQYCYLKETPILCVWAVNFRIQQVALQHAIRTVHHNYK
jgi:hypothetical protein